MFKSCRPDFLWRWLFDARRSGAAVRLEFRIYDDGSAPGDFSNEPGRNCRRSHRYRNLKYAIELLSSNLVAGLGGVGDIQRDLQICPGARSRGDIRPLNSGDRRRELAAAGPASTAIRLARAWALAYPPGCLPRRTGSDLPSDGRSMTLTLRISPTGHLFVEEHEGQQSELLDTARARRIAKAFRTSAAAGLLHLATAELESRLPPDLAFAREFAGQYLTQLCHTPDLQTNAAAGLISPDNDKLAALARPRTTARRRISNAVALAGWWIELDQWVRNEGASHPGGLAEYLREKNPLWRQVGRVTFHLAENKRDRAFPFAFLATYTGRLSSAGRPQHKPLGEA